MNEFLERLVVENSNKCNELGTEIEDLKRKMFDLQCDYNIVVGKHNELADRIDKALEYIEEHKVYNKGFEKYDICDLDIKNILEILKGEE